MTIDTTVTNGRFVGSDDVFEHSISIHEGRVLEAPEFDDVWRTIDASGHLVFPGLIQPVAGDLLALVRRGVTTVIGSGTDLPMDFITTASCPQALLATEPGAINCAREESQMIELPVQMLERDPVWWDVVTDDATLVHITHGGDAGYPLLQYLYDRGLPPIRIAEVTSQIPARWYGVYPRKGSFDSGSHGDVLVFDPDSHDPYHDDDHPGRVIMSIQRGEMLLYNGQIHAPAGAGKDLLT